MKNNSKIEITDLLTKTTDSNLKSLSEVETAQIVGGGYFSSLFSSYLRSIRSRSTGMSPERPRDSTSSNL